VTKCSISRSFSEMPLARRSLSMVSGTGPPKGVPAPEFPPKLPPETFEDCDWRTLSKFSKVLALCNWLPRGFLFRDCGDYYRFTDAFGVLVFIVIELRWNISPWC
jgi:hypothetical protein